MATPEEIEEWKKRNAHRPINELIREKNRWASYTVEHIAATELVDERRDSISEQRHQEGLQESRKATVTAKQALWVAIVSGVLALGSLVVAVIALRH